MLNSRSNFAQAVVSIMGGAMAISGAFFWIVGCLGLVGIGFILTESPAQIPLEDYLAAFGATLPFILLQAFSSGMMYFGRTLYDRSPEPIPGDLLPKLWFARFMKLLCFSALLFFLPPFFANLANLRWMTLPYALAGTGAFWASRHFGRQAERWTPPYPGAYSPFVVSEEPKQEKIDL